MNDRDVKILVRKSKDSAVYEYVPKSVVETSGDVDSEYVIDYYTLDEKGKSKPTYRKEYFWK